MGSEMCIRDSTWMYGRCQRRRRCPATGTVGALARGCPACVDGVREPRAAPVAHRHHECRVRGRGGPPSAPLLFVGARCGSGRQRDAAALLAEAPPAGRHTRDCGRQPAPTRGHSWDPGSTDQAAAQRRRPRIAHLHLTPRPAPLLATNPWQHAVLALHRPAAAARPGSQQPGRHRRVLSLIHI